jgi:small multidrug resistance family-3 protein
MLNGMVLPILAAAALLEAGGDAIVSSGLHAPTIAAKGGLIALGGLVLLAYGVVVNTPSWDFGRLLGVYVTLFFLAAQAINFLAFGVRPDLSVLLGGLLIVSGGLLMTFWHVR